MLTVSFLPGLIDLPPVKPDVGGGGGFAPLMARLLGPEIKADGISLPAGGEMLPGGAPIAVSLSPDAPEFPPSILIVAGTPMLADPEPAIKPSPPIVATPAPPPARFAPIMAPMPSPASLAPAADPLLPPVPIVPAATDGPRAPFGATRTALLASVATTSPMAHPVSDAPLQPTLPADAPAKLAATGRKAATIELVPEEIDDTPSSEATAIEPMAGTVPVDALVLPDAARVLVAPPPAESPVASPKAALAPSTTRAAVDPPARPAVAPRAMERAPARDVAAEAARPIARSTTAGTGPASAQPIVETSGGPALRQVRPTMPVTESPPSSPTVETSAATPVGRLSNAGQEVRAPIASAAAAQGPEPRQGVATAPEARADMAEAFRRQRAARPITVDARPAVDASTAISNATQRVVPAVPAARADSLRVIAPPGIEAPIVTAALQGGGAPAPMPTDATVPFREPQRPEAPATLGTDRAGVILAGGILAGGGRVIVPSPLAVPVAAASGMRTDVTAASRDQRRPDSPAATLPVTERAGVTTIAAPQAAPLILPALQAFGAAIRRAMADERKSVPAGDDAGLGLTVLAGTTPATAAPMVAPDERTLDTTDRRWPQAMAEQIEKLRDAADARSTRIRLLPDALGPVDIAVRRDGEQVHVHFAAADAQTRQLLADAQPRLADAAEARGLKLGRTDVSSGDLAGGDRQPQQRPATHDQHPSRPAPARARAPTAGTDDSRLA